jgi:hypothetical protein
MGEELEPIVASDADERDTGRIRRPHSQRRRGGYSHDDGCTDHPGFLHQLNRDSARENDDAIGNRLASAQERPCQFVECVVPSDIFAEQEIAISLPKPGRMD